MEKSALVDLVEKLTGLARQTESRPTGWDVKIIRGEDGLITHLEVRAVDGTGSEQ